jgi:polyisoprenoid-binding protein YceI
VRQGVGEGAESAKSAAEISAVDGGTAGKLTVTGDLTLAGVTKSVTLAVDGPTAPVKGQGGKLVTGFSATKR